MGQHGVGTARRAGTGGREGGVGVNISSARRVANTIFYEGYVLYPYRASAQKNRSRWQFGVVMPATYAATDPSESAVNQTECVVKYTMDTSLCVVVRFLQLQRRTVAERQASTGAFAAVDSLDVAGTRLSTWDEAVEHEIAIPTN